MKSCFVIDVGHGNAAILVGKTNNVLVDAGPGAQLITFLEELNIDSSLALIISHADADHVRGAIALLSKVAEEGKFSLAHIYVNSDSRNTDVWDDFIYWANRVSKTGTHVQVSVGAGQCGPFDLGECVAEVIAPTLENLLHGVGGVTENNEKLTANSLSSVIKFLVDGKELVLLPGDMDLASLRSIQAEGISLSSGTIIYPHHGGRPGTSDANIINAFVAGLIQDVNPEVVIFSSRSNDAKFPSQPVVSAVLDQPSKPRIVSIGVSPNITTAIAGIDPCPHVNGAGSIRISWDTSTQQIKLARIDRTEMPHKEIAIT